MNTIHILFLTAAIFIIKSKEVEGSTYKRVCYYTNWSQYHMGDGHFMPSDIDANLCTHIIFAFAKLVGNDITTIEPNDKQLYKELVALKTQNPSLKVTLAVGGWNAGSVQFSKMAATESSRSAFIKNTIRFLRTNNLDGLDIDWEYPAKRGGIAADKHNFGQLLKEMRAAYEQESAKSGENRLLVSVAVPAGKSSIDSGYDVKAVAQNVDFINLMTYDLHGPWEGKAGENSPLYAKQSETGANVQLNTAWAANYWNKMGAPKDKIIVGISFFGKSYNLASSANYEVGAKITGAGPAGKYTGERGVLAYYENCKMQETGGTTYWEKEQRVPYYVNGNLWVGYDNVRSIQEKAEFVKNEGFGGIMIWSLDGDDSKKICSSSKTNYPLLKTIADSLSDTQQSTNESAKATSSTIKAAPTTSTQTTAAQTTPKPTTAAQTTPKPTTSAQTTPKQTRSAQTTPKQTRSAQTTPKPTTSAQTIPKQTTSAQTTPKPTTAEQTTSKPTITSHTTSKPSTATATAPKSTIASHSTLKLNTAAKTTLKSKLTSAVSTTSKPSTTEQTTSKPTPVVPTDSKQSSAEPTTSKSTKDVQTTLKLSTAAQTTSRPTSDAKTTSKLTTDAQTTSKLTTDAQTTSKLTTDAQTTSKLTTATLSSSASSSFSLISRIHTTVKPQSSNAVPTKIPPKKSASFSCTLRSDGFYSDPSSCSGFYRCFGGHGFRFTCPNGTQYNPKISVCDWPRNVMCAGRS